MADISAHEDLVVMNGNLLAIKGHIEGTVVGVHLTQHHRPAMVGPPDEQLLAIRLLSALNGAKRYLTSRGGHPHQVSPVRVGQHLVVPVPVLATGVGHVTHAVRGNHLFYG